VRVKPVTQTALEIFTVELITQTGKKDISADTALWTLIKKARPDIAERAEKLVENEGRDKNNKE
jgi:hypothetical protein